MAQMSPPSIHVVLAAEGAAIVHYRDLIEQTDGFDWVTQDQAISILADQERHRRLFHCFLLEYERKPELTSSEVCDAQ
jgi:ferritin-like protein